ncbi:MAG TPA: hypothetical protein VEV15_04510 [Flavisolibacter sp.]|nr:hypothetical protein [Flavisolibacter sp.]
MPQRNRNEVRERKGGEPRRTQSDEEKRYSSSRNGERVNSVAKVNNERTVRMSSDRENDLYERQSI